MAKRIFKSNRGQVIGRLDGNFFRKEVSKHKHLFKSADAWGVASEIINELPAECNIVIHDKDEDINYITTKEQFMAKGFRREFGMYGPQIFMPRKSFLLGGMNTLFE